MLLQLLLLLLLPSPGLPLITSVPPQSSVEEAAVLPLDLAELPPSPF